MQQHATCTWALTCFLVVPMCKLCCCCIPLQLAMIDAGALQIALCGGGIDLSIYLCIIYSTVGRSIANILDRGTIFTEAQSAEGNMPSIKVRYRGYGPTYRTICDILYGECATDEPFCVRRLNIFEKKPFSKKSHFSLRGLFHLYRTSSQYIISYGCIITIRYISIT